MQAEGVDVQPAGVGGQPEGVENQAPPRVWRAGAMRRALGGAWALLASYREPLALWLGWRVALLLLPFWASFLFPASRLISDQPPVPPAAHIIVERLVRTWARFDSGFYTSIAARGYALPEDVAFYPLYPLAIKLVATTTRLETLGYDGYNLSGIIVSNLASLAIFCLLYRLALLDQPEPAARRAMLYLAIWPLSFFLAAIYNDGLCIALALGAFLQARRGRWHWALGLAALAALTRNQGLLLLPALAVEYAQQRRWRPRALLDWPLLGMLFPLLAFAGWLYLNSQVYGSPLAFFEIQHSWGRIDSNPVKTLRTAWHMLRFDAPFEVWPRDFSQGMRELVDLPITLIYLGLTLLVLWLALRRRLPWSYAVYSLCVALLPLFTRMDGYPLESMPRYGLQIFPAFIALGALGARWRWLHYALLMICPLFLGLLLARFTLYFFVA